jgi:hypothetical protein
MSILHNIYPVQAALPVAQSFFGSTTAMVRPLFGAAALTTLLVVFRPLVIGVFQATRLVFSPRLSLDDRKVRRTMKDVLMLNRMARDLDQTQPNQAAELRFLASRG